MSLFIKATKIKTDDKCGNCKDGKMELADPLIKHPQLTGFYRSRCGKCQWLGWTEYEVSAPPVDQAAQAATQAAMEWSTLAHNHMAKKNIIEAGIMDESDFPELATERQTLKDTYVEGYRI